MVDITLGVFLVDGIQLLSSGQSVQGADGQNLSLATGEQTGTVNAGQNADLSVQGKIGRASCRERVCLSV